MKSLKYHFLSLIFIILCFNCSNEAAEKEETNGLDSKNYYQELNISYGNDNHQKFDLYLPANRNLNTKTIVLIHGGGWTSGDKEDMNPIKDLLRIDFPDIAVANINYRLADTNNKAYPMQIEDISSVINYLKNNKEKYTISENIGFIGTSAGAHLSLLWSYAFDNDNNTNMVCSIVGPTNFTDPAYLNSASTELQELLDLLGVNRTTPFLEEVSPYHQVTASAPPTILFYGGKDPLIPTTQGTDLRDRLEDLGVINQFTLYPNAGHGWVGLELLDTWTKLKIFINNHL
ncbi:alpha/beta hydrolase [Flavivirga spongiicola]|uniref:Alpha/beta hydrolase n=1 Tax=Flavivirga spongiicola TaxID=421621 RepID=A0ABU7XY07_9FLAO|nr:alpha/beta hydrolase [Flavivirga sp. MEBiC05379]MDO5980343.1 alpha/beta hydrolase [Flavivirga sp. MEBiC05379]